MTAAELEETFFKAVELELARSTSINAWTNGIDWPRNWSNLRMIRWDVNLKKWIRIR
jgi:hypothetical protein